MTEEQLADAIGRFWAKRGYKVRIAITGAGIRSNLRNGLPRDFDWDRGVVRELAQHARGVAVRTEP